MDEIGQVNHGRQLTIELGVCRHKLLASCPPSLRPRRLQGHELEAGEGIMGERRPGQHLPVLRCRQCILGATMLAVTASIYLLM
jgi:hypothetical protein